MEPAMAAANFGGPGIGMDMYSQGMQGAVPPIGDLAFGQTGQLQFTPPPPPEIPGIPVLSPLNYHMGLRTPMHRLVFWGLVTGAVLYATRPKLMFSSTGVPRPWSLLGSNVVDARARSEMTHIPWYIAAFGAGLVIAHIC